MAENHRPPETRSSWRWIRRTILVAVAICALYLLGANLFLNTELAARLINQRPEKSLVRWDRAWTLAPGRIEARGLRFRGQQTSARWSLELASAEVRFRLLPLVSRRFETLSIRGEGLAFRHRLLPEPGKEHQRPEALPPIPEPDPFPGSGPSALPETETEPAPPSHRAPWVVDLAGIHIRNVRELWVDTYRFVGDGELRAGCHFEIRGPFEMERSSLELTGELTSGGEPVAEELSFAIEARLHPFVFGQNKGREALRFLDATARVSSPRASLGVLDQYFRGTEWLAIDGTGRLDAEAALERGILLPGTWFEAKEGQFDLDYLDFQASGTGWASGKVEVAGARSMALLEARLDTFDLRRRGARTPHIRGSGFEVRASSPGPDLVVLKPDFDAIIDLPPSEIIDLTSYNTYISEGSGFRFTSGRATLQAHLELSTSTRSGSGHVLLEGHRIAATLGEIGMVGDLTLSSKLTNADPETRRFDLSGSHLELKQVLVQEPGRSDPSYWWAHFDLPEGKVRLGHPLELEARLAARVRDSRPIIAMVAQKRPLLRRMRPILEVQDLDLQGRVELLHDSLRIENLVLTGDGLEILAHLEVVARKPSGAVFLRRGPFSAALSLDEGESTWKIFGARKWFRARDSSARRP